MTLHCAPAPLLLPDNSGEYLFRTRTARHLAGVWLKRANALIACGDAGVKLRCECGQAHVVPFRCGARSCPVCAKIASARVTARISLRVQVARESRRMEELWDGKGKPRRKGWKLFTGTSRAGDVETRFAPDVLAERIGRVRRAWGPFWRSTPWGARRRVREEWQTATGVKVTYSRRARRDTAAIMGIEVAPGGMVHCHAGIYGEYVPTDELAALWSAALDEPAYVNIRAMRAQTPADFESALREVLKYATKLHKKSDEREAHAAAIEAGLKRVRRVEMVGAIRSMPGVDELVKRGDPDACTGCGQTETTVRWVGIWNPEKVRANGGFGPVVAALDDAERRKWRRNPGRAKLESERDAHGDLAAVDAATDAGTDFSADTEEKQHG